MVVRHLLARCPICAAACRQLLRGPSSSPPADPDAYEPAFERAAALLKKSSQGADGDWQGGMEMGCSMDPEELLDEARGNLLTALARLDDIDRALAGAAVPPPRARCQVVLLSAHRRNRQRPPKGRLGRGGR